MFAVDAGLLSEEKVKIKANSRIPDLSVIFTL